MEELQKLLNLLKLKKENAFIGMCQNKGVDNNLWQRFKGQYEAFSFCIDEAEKLLKT
jgi:hypothetical protein